MSIEFKIGELHISLKSVLLSVSAQLPLFFVAVYLFNKPFVARIENIGFISDLDFWFMLCCCFGLSLVWYSISFLNAVAFLVIAERKLHVDIEKPAVHIMTTIFSLLFLASSIFVCYTERLSFSDFLTVSFLGVGMAGVFFIIYGSVKYRSRSDNSPSQNTPDKKRRKIFARKKRNPPFSKIP